MTKKPDAMLSLAFTFCAGADLPDDHWLRMSQLPNELPPGTMDYLRRVAATDIDHALNLAVQIGAQYLLGRNAGWTGRRRKNGGNTRATQRKASAAVWHAPVKDIWLAKRGRFPKVGRQRPGAMSQMSLATWIILNRADIPNLPANEQSLIDAFRDWEGVRRPRRFRAPARGSAPMRVAAGS